MALREAIASAAAVWGLVVERNCMNGVGPLLSEANGLPKSYLIEAIGYTKRDEKKKK